ncbi:hypothetical protein W909_15700 [Dickeya zeae EC1]|nr:hypothetical protein W909_15700 [Dickeya zeae EC1]
MWIFFMWIFFMWIVFMWIVLMLSFNTGSGARGR